MATLKNTIRYKGNYCYVELVFTTEYDAKTNRTTVIFNGAALNLGTISEFGYISYVSVSVKADDNAESIGETASNASVGVPPELDTITVQHGPDAGKKSVTVTMFARVTFSLGMGASSTNSISVVAGVRQGIGYIDTGLAVEQYGAYIEDGTAYSLYAPYIDNGSGWEAN